MVKNYKRLRGSNYQYQNDISIFSNNLENLVTQLEVEISSERYFDFDFSS